MKSKKKEINFKSKEILFSLRLVRSFIFITQTRQVHKKRCIEVNYHTFRLSELVWQKFPLFHWPKSFYQKRSSCSCNHSCKHSQSIYFKYFFPYVIPQILTKSLCSSRIAVLGMNSLSWNSFYYPVIQKVRQGTCSPTVHLQVT